VWEGKAGASFNQIQKILIKALSLSLSILQPRKTTKREKYNEALQLQGKKLH